MVEFEVRVRGKLSDEEGEKLKHAGFSHACEITAGRSESRTVTERVSGRARSREALRAELVALGLQFDRLLRDPDARVADAELWRLLVEHEDGPVREWFETIHGVGTTIRHHQASAAEFWADLAWFEEAYARARERDPEAEQRMIECLRARSGAS